MINRSTAQSLMADIWADNDNDNELKKAYFGEHPLHDEAVDTLWGLNWFANGHPQDDVGDPLPLDRLAPDERRAAQEGLKAVYPLRSEIDKRQGAALPWDKIAPEGAANINQARQKYLQTIDPVYSTALHDRDHPAHESVKAHYGAWQDWQLGAPGPAPRWGDLDPVNPYDRKAVSPLRNPWTAAALTDPGDTGLLGAGLAAGARGAAAPAAPSQPDSGDDPAPGPISPSILKALSHLFAANVAGHLGIDPPKRLAPDNTDDGSGDGSLNGGAKAGELKTLKYVPDRDGQPNLTAKPYGLDRDGPVKFRRVNDDGADSAPEGDDRESAFEAAQGAQGGTQGQEKYRAPADDETLPLDQRVAGFKQRARGFGVSEKAVRLFDAFASLTNDGRSLRRTHALIESLVSEITLPSAALLIDLLNKAKDPRTALPPIKALQYVENVLMRSVVDRNLPMPSKLNQAGIALDQYWPDSLPGSAYAYFASGQNDRAFAALMTREIEDARAKGLDTIPSLIGPANGDHNALTTYEGMRVGDLVTHRDRLLAEAARKEEAWNAQRAEAQKRYDDLPSSRDPFDVLARLGGGLAGALGPDAAAFGALKYGFRVAGQAQRTIGETIAKQTQTGSLIELAHKPRKAFPTTRLVNELFNVNPAAADRQRFFGEFNRLKGLSAEETKIDLARAAHRLRGDEFYKEPVFVFPDGGFTKADGLALRPGALERGMLNPSGMKFKVDGSIYDLAVADIGPVYEIKSGAAGASAPEGRLKRQMADLGLSHLYRLGWATVSDLNVDKLAVQLANSPHGRRFTQDQLRLIIGNFIKGLDRNQYAVPVLIGLSAHLADKADEIDGGNSR